MVHSGLMEAEAAGQLPEEVLANQARILEREDPERAVEVWKAASKLNGLESVYFYRAGKGLMGLKRYGEAAEQFQQSLRLLPEHTATRFSLAKSLACSGQLPAALEEVDKVRDEQPLHPAAIALRFHLLVLLERYEEALDFYSKFEQDLQSASSAMARLLALRVGKGTEPLASNLKPAVRNGLSKLLRVERGTPEWLELACVVILKC